MRLSALTSLTTEHVEEVRAILAAARAADGVAPLSESFRLAVSRGDVRHLVAYAADGAVSGYAQIDRGGTAELVVPPAHRGQGVGRALIGEALALGAQRFWAHGSLPRASELASAAGLDPLRELHLMARPLTADDTHPPTLPEGLGVSTFADRGNADEWVSLNAAAFATHPEQGQLTRADFDARAAEPWFEPEGLIYLLDATQPAEHPAIAFHWTKIDPTSAGSGVGEVYVVGVHPAYQGRGLSGPLTQLGLAHLARRGCTEVVLYVDGDNTRALSTYRALGFTDRAVDVLFGA